MENNISQAAFNQKLFFPIKKDILQRLFKEWRESNGVEFDTNWVFLWRQNLTLRYNIGNLIDSLSGARCNPHEQVAQVISSFLIATCCDFQNASSTAAGFWGLIITVTIFSNVIGA